MRHYLDFEQGVAELECKAIELRRITDQDNNIDIQEEISQLESKAELRLRELYSKLSSWQKCQVARHPERPKIEDYINGMFTDFTRLDGDRQFSDDPAIIGGTCFFHRTSVLVIGHNKGHDTHSRVRCNFGMPQPEGYRKAVRLMKLADRFNMPVISFVDTPGAYPGKEAEERGQAEAIARSIEACLEISVPIISFIIGEGGSGGAIAIATANHVSMLENSIYSVISPEGCAAILWKDSQKCREAAETLKLTAQDLLKLGIIDNIIPEPIGGAQRDHAATIKNVSGIIDNLLHGEFMNFNRDLIKIQRREKFIHMGDPQKIASV